MSNSKLKLQYQANGIILQEDLDTAYLVTLEASSWADRFHLLTSNDDKRFNAPIYIHAKIIKNVMSIDTEANVAVLYMECT